MDRRGSGLSDMQLLTVNNNGAVSFGPSNDNQSFEVVISARPEAVDEVTNTALPVCTINGTRSFLFTSGFMPELGTYPGPHVPQPFEVRCLGPENPIAASQDVLNLTRMNWNTADIRSKWPVSMSFARRVGGILDEYGDDDLTETSFRYFV